MALRSMVGSLLVFASAGVLAATPAQAPSRATFDEIDGNHADRITYEEYRNFGVGIFHVVDKNHDQKIDKTENSAATSDVTIEDYNLALRDWFDRTDTDKDGFVDRPEWKAAPVGPARETAGDKQ